MTVSIHLTKRIYTANGITREWSLDFPFLSVENLQIYISSPAGQETRVESNYALNDEGTALIYPTLESEQAPLADGWKITILRQTPVTQEIDLLRQGELDAEVLEQGYDKLTLITQELAEEIDRCIKYPVSTQPQSLDGDTFLDGILAAKQSALTSAQTAQASAALASQTAQTAASSLSTQAQTLSDGLSQVAQTAASSLSTQAQTLSAGFLQTEATVEQARQTAVASAEQAQSAAQTIQNALSSKADVSALSSLADVSLSNITNTGKSLMAGQSMPSTTYVDLTLGASGATYTAPANGWFVSYFRCTEAQIGTWVNETTGMSNSGSTAGAWTYVGCSIPVKSGDICTYYYNHRTGSSYVYSFRFVYAEGSKSEEI